MQCRGVEWGASEIVDPWSTRFVDAISRPCFPDIAGGRNVSQSWSAAYEWKNVLCSSSSRAAQETVVCTSGSSAPASAATAASAATVPTAEDTKSAWYYKIVEYC